MNIESYLYTIFSAIIGMIIVFTFLGFLSGLMDIMKRIFKNKKEGIEEIKVKNEIEKPEWVLAAVSIYLMLEENKKYKNTANAWKIDTNKLFTPWIFRGRTF